MHLSVHSTEPCNQCSSKYKPFNHKNITRWTPGPENECSCETGKQKCPVGSYGPEPPKRVVETGDVVFDVTGRDISDYLLKTTDDFIRQRYINIFSKSRLSPFDVRLA